MRPFRESPARAALLAIYAEVDLLLAPFACDDSTECCRFGITGREPYPTAVELELLREAIRARPFAVGEPAKRGLRQAREEAADGRCPLLSGDGRCRVYAVRPFGCRTFFCERRTGPAKLPRTEIQRLSRAIAELSEDAFPRDPGPRPLTRALAPPGKKR